MMTRHKKIIILSVILFLLIGISSWVAKEVVEDNTLMGKNTYSGETENYSTVREKNLEKETNEEAAESVEAEIKIAVEESLEEDSVVIQSEEVNEEAKESEVLSEKDEYIARLDKLNEVLENTFNNLSDTTTIGMNNAKNQELTQWDNELNKIYRMLREKLPEDEFIILRDEERQWIVDRDEKANAAAAKYEGGTLAGLEYLRVQVNTTKERTYELVDLYFAE